MDESSARSGLRASVLRGVWRRSRRGLCLLGLAALVASGIALLMRPEPTVRATAPLTGASSEAPTAYTLLRARTRRRALTAQARSSAQPRSWLLAGTAARSWLDSARLTGDFEDYSLAVEAADRAVAAAGGRHPAPLLARAHVGAALHRFDSALEDLEAAELLSHGMAPQRESIRLLRADIALRRGDLGASEATYREVIAASSSFGARARLAHLLAATGRLEEAERHWQEAERSLSPTDTRGRAWIELQRGVADLDSGVARDALVHFRRADRALDGWWLIQEHLAETLARLGRTDEAIELYRAVVESTSNPEFMDSLADLLTPWAPHRSALLHARAGRAYRARIARFPEAVWGHAVAHYLSAPEDAPVALRLAELNYQNQPGPEAALLYARSALANRERARACELLDDVSRSRWRSRDAASMRDGC